jgi:zinc and cadmium transporter
MVLEQILLWTVVGSVLGLVGGLALLWKEKATRRFSGYLVSLAAGALLGVTFFDFIPELLEANAPGNVFIWSLGGILLFFVVERLLRWHHHHPGRETHIFTYTLMLGDTVHNFVDGIVIAATFLLEPSLGIITAIAVFLHEVPQEISDFGALLHGGWSKLKIIKYNLFSAVAAIAGALLTFYFGTTAAISQNLVALTIGIFLYVAVIDLLPQAYYSDRENIGWHITAIVLGIAMMWAVGIAVPE